MDHEVELTQKIIGCAIEVHRNLGPGLLEAPYVAALAIELAHNQLQFERQRKIPLQYRGASIGGYKIDLIVENRVVVEVKSALRDEAVFSAQVLTYLRITGLRVGLLLNFNKGVLKDGIKRFVL